MPLIDNEWDSDPRDTVSEGKAALVVLVLFTCGLACALVMMVTGA